MTTTTSKPPSIYEMKEAISGRTPELNPTHQRRAVELLLQAEKMATFYAQASYEGVRRFPLTLDLGERAREFLEELHGKKKGAA